MPKEPSQTVKFALDLKVEALLAAACVPRTELAVRRLTRVLDSRSIDLTSTLKQPRDGLSVVALHALLILKGQVLSVGVAIVSSPCVASLDQGDLSPRSLGSQAGERGPKVDALTV